MTRIISRIGAALFAAAVTTASLVQAQRMLSTAEGDRQQVEILADEGIELRQDERLIIVSGNARLLRGDFEVRADVLRAHYVGDDEAELRIERVRAEGNVRISSPEETAWGGLADYDVKQGAIVLSGGDLRLKTQSMLVTADQQLEYWEDKQMAIARGNATVTGDGRSLQADVLSAYFRSTGDNASRIERVEASGNVRIQTENEVVEAHRGVYDVKSSIVTLTDRVKLLREGNQLVGCSAQIDMKTGVSRLQSCQNDGARVKGVLIPGTTR